MNYNIKNEKKYDGEEDDGYTDEWINKAFILSNVNIPKKKCYLNLQMLLME